MNTLRSSDTTCWSRFILRVSRDADFSAREQAFVLVVLSTQAERAILDWIPVISRLCAVQQVGSIDVSSSRVKRPCPLIVSAYATTECCSAGDKLEFYRDLLALVFICAPTRKSQVLHSYFRMTTADPSSTRSFQCGYRHNQMSKTRRRNVYRSQKPRNQPQMSRRTSCSMTHENSEYLRFHLLCRMLPDPSLRNHLL